MAQCKPDQHHQPLKDTIYIYCQNCGAVYDSHGREVLNPTQRCPGWVYHHDGDVCLECGLDERSGGFKTCRTSELQNLRIARRLSPMSAYLQWDEERSALYKRIRQGEVIPLEQYQPSQRK